MSDPLATRAVGADVVRADAVQKVLGLAPYAVEHDVPEVVHAHPIHATVARGRITAVDTSAARRVDGVLGVVTHENAPRLHDDEDRELWILQDAEVHFRGQLVGVTVAETAEAAREAAALVAITYEEDEHDARFHEGAEAYAPEQLNAGFETDTRDGDVDAGMRRADVTVEETYTTPFEHNNPMEPHATVARWNADARCLTLHDSTQSVFGVRRTMAKLLALEPEEVHVTAPYVGGGFGSKGLPHSHVVLAALAAQTFPGRSVKLAMSRQSLFAIAGYRPPTIQRVRLAATTDGSLTALALHNLQPTSRIKRYAEQTGTPSRTMYASGSRATTHRLVDLDIAVPSWFRAPGECPGMFGPEVAMDELAHALGIDPIELRIRNEPEVDPDSGNPWSSRNLVACLREGAARFGWADRDPTPRVRQDGRWLVGTGVASSLYPVYRMSGSTARVSYRGEGRYEVHIGAADIGTGAWTVLAQIAADALDVPLDRIDLQIGDTALPPASVAGGSSGTTTWGSAIVAAARAFRDAHGDDPEPGATAQEDAPENEHADDYAMSAFGAQFAEVRVHALTGEVRVPRMLGVFAAGRIVNPRTARSQFIGGMTMALGMALLEEGVLDPRFGHVVNHDLAEYHVPANADVCDIDAVALDEDDPYVNAMGSKGIGEIGIVGGAAAIANAVFHATGTRVRQLPITPDHLL